MLVIFAGALVGAVGVRAGGNKVEDGMGKEWVPLVMALFVMAVGLAVAEGIERRRVRKEGRERGGGRIEPRSESPTVVGDE